MKKNKPMIFLIVVASLGIIISSTGLAGAATKHLKVGSIHPISGPISFLGVAFNRGYELAFDKANKAGGIKIGGDNYLLELIAEDSKMSTEGTTQSARKLVHKDKVQFIFGAILSNCTAAITEVTEPAGALHLISNMDETLHPADVSPDKPLTVRLSLSNDAAYEADYDYIKKRYPDLKTVALVVDQGYAGMRARATKVAAERGLKVVHEEQWPFGIEDFIPVYTRVLTYKPDIIQCMVSAQAGDQLRAARQLGFKGIFISDIPLSPHVIIDQAGPEFCYDVISNGITEVAYTPEMKDVDERWVEKYKEPFISDALIAYDEGWMLIQAIEKAGSVDPKDVVAAFDKMTAPGSLKTVFGPGRMAGKERFGVNRVPSRPIPVMVIDNDKTKLVGFFDPVVP